MAKILESKTSSWWGYEIHCDGEKLDEFDGFYNESSARAVATHRSRKVTENTSPPNVRIFYRNWFLGKKNYVDSKTC